MENGVALASIALVGTILAMVVKPLFSLLKANTAATSNLSKSMDKVAESNKEIAKETKQGNKEAKQRNGHLAELVNEGNTHMTDILKTINDTGVKNNISTQKILSTIETSADRLSISNHIENQTVDHQVIKSVESKEK